MRSKVLVELLNSVRNQTIYPNEILIIDGSLNEETQLILENNTFKNVTYFKVDDKNRGLTKQRNYGIEKVNSNSEIVFFLDDDTILEKDYFEEILKTYIKFPEAVAVGGYIINEIQWEKVNENYNSKSNEFVFDSWKRIDGNRFVLRKKLGLDANVPPGYMPQFSNGRSLSFLPPSGKIYKVEQLMGGVSSFKKSIFNSNKFSTYFEGYGLYEDADFTIRIAKTGNLYLNTNAKLSHFHEVSGRPNQFKYGKMVVRNGWYVWRVKNPNPIFKDKIKWHLIIVLLTFIRFGNSFTSTNKKAAFSETVGRIIGWLSLIFNKPKE